MAEENQTTAPPARPEPHHPAAGMNPEQHLLETHGLSVRIQGKEGPTGEGVWALVKEERGKVKTLTVQRGTRREAAAHFFDYIHPDKSAFQPLPSQRGPAGPRPGSRPPQRSSRPQGGPPRSGGAPRPGGPSRPGGPPRPQGGPPRPQGGPPRP